MVVGAGRGRGGGGGRSPKVDRKDGGGCQASFFHGLTSNDWLSPAGSHLPNIPKPSKSAPSLRTGHLVYESSRKTLSPTHN